MANYSPATVRGFSLTADCDTDLLLASAASDFQVLLRVGIEPPTHGFSGGQGNFGLQFIQSRAKAFLRRFLSCAAENQANLSDPGSY